MIFWPAMGGRRRFRLGALIALCLALYAAAPLAALAAGPAPPRPSDLPCPPGNLLAAATLSDSLDFAGLTRVVADSTVVAEGARWGNSNGLRFETAAGSLTYDLGARMRIASAYVQADANNTFSLQVSDDGKTFREIWRVPDAAASGPGMRSRATMFWDEGARFVRFGEPTGNGSYAVTELQVFCKIPADWPPHLALSPGDAPPAPRPHRLTRRDTDLAKMGLAFLGALLLGWGHILKRRGAPQRHQRLRDVLLLVLGVLGYTGYYNWGHYHFQERIHVYEFFHYYVGAKYFPELGYTGLYECANVAEAEQGFRSRVELRKIRDLTKNELVPAKYVLEDPERYKKGFTRPFTPARWNEFKQDCAYFRDRAGIATWERIVQDNGYNPSPVWNMTGSLLANLGHASKSFIDGFLGWIDPALVLIAFGFIVWAFGWRTACVAAIFFGTNAAALYFWTGGAYLRQDWFAWAVIGICLLKRGKPLLGGAGLAVSTLLRVFPVGFFVAIGLRILWILFRERRIDPTGARIVAGAALAVALLIPASSMVAGGFSAWPMFLKNTAKHAGTPLTNDMGLRTVLSFRWETRQKISYDPKLVDPFHAFKEARRQAFRGILGRPLFVLLVGAYMLLLFRGVRREMEWWVLAAFGFGVIPMCLELTCYYYSFLTAAALLGGKRDEIPIGLLVLSGMSQVVVFATYFYDMRYTLESVVALAFVVWATWVWGGRRSDAGPPPVRSEATSTC